MIDKVLNSRYKVTDLLGEGGMALVYQARDLLLDRWVALKVLRPQLVSDKDFVRRFHREAKAVASLSHPNIVNIYDIGQDRDIHYLVMENVQGETMSEVIKREGILPPSLAFDYATQICEALVVAHRNNIVHCDIKPHNILITKDNRIKVTDFGIARAVNSATLAHTETVIGTATYFSPEQARGETITASSDLYSLGVVIYEMLTGQVPFRGDSPITVALKHINEEPVAPSHVNDRLPKRIDKLVLKVLAKDPGKRFADASEMLKAMHGLARTLDNAHDAGLNMTKPYSANDETQVLPRIRDTRKVKEPADEQAKEDKSGENLIGKLIKPLFFAIIAFTALGLFTIFGISHYTNVPEVKTPNFIGMSKEEATTEARKIGIRVNFNDLRVASDLPEDHVAAQDINAGRKVKKNRVIELTLSRGATKAKVPNLIGKEMREVTIALDEADLALGEVGYEYSTQIPKGVVLAQTPITDTEVAPGEKVNLIFSQGPAPKLGSIPYVIGLNRSEAERTIKEANFVVGTITEEETTRFPQGVIARQDPAPGTEINEETPVNLVISSGIRNPKNFHIYTVQAVYFIPPGPYNQRIQIVVEDENGREVVYDRVHHPEDRVSVENIHVVGPSVVEIYNNGEKVKEQQYGF